MLKGWGTGSSVSPQGRTHSRQSKAIPPLDLILMDINFGKGMDGTEAAVNHDD